jgi:hypothetical protein
MNVIQVFIIKLLPMKVCSVYWAQLNMFHLVLLDYADKASLRNVRCLDWCVLFREWKKFNWSTIGTTITHIIKRGLKVGPTYDEQWRN